MLADGGSEPKDIPFNTGAANGTSDEPGVDVVDSFGSLSISDTGKTSYFGQATSSWVRSSYLS